MNDLFIQGLTIDWNRVRPYNYVRQIPAISGIDTFTFHKPITFFVGENGSGKSSILDMMVRFWKQSLLLTASTQRVERRTIHFPHTTPIRNYVRL